jgi:Arc/MetJ family transcription regulator
MRTNIDIDDALMERTLKATGLPTKRAAVEEGLRLLLHRHERQGILALAGQVAWEGDLAQSRLARGFAETGDEFVPAPCPASP